MVTVARGARRLGMGVNVRIIPRLDIKGPNLVKGVHLEGLRVLGKPERFARFYYEQGADEILYMDVVASLYGRNSLLDMVARTSREIFVPLTVCGGLRTLDDIRAVLRAGADKVAINTAAIRDPELIRGAAERFGSSTIVVSIEAIRQREGRFEAYTDNGREPTGVEVLEWAERAAALGAGELMITSADREGTGAGVDLEGTGGGLRGFCLASMLPYNFTRHHRDDGEFEGEGNIVYLKTRESLSKIQDATIPQLKASLQAHGVPFRPVSTVYAPI